MTKPLNVGIIGYGFMGRTHSNAYRKVRNFFDVPYEPVLKTICGLDEKEAKAFADRWGYQSHTTDWRKVIDDKKIDIVDICVPNNYHAEIAIAAAQAGKMIICEKPLARTGAEAEPMVQAVEKAGVANLVSFNYRRVPAVTLAKKLIDEGRLGRIFHYRANFLQDWTISAEAAPGRHGHVAAGRQGGRLRRDGRPAGPLHRHGPVAQRSHRLRVRDDRDLRERADAHRDGQGRAGRHRRRVHVLLPVPERLAGQLRVHPLRPRPQGPLHLRNQRRARLHRAGTCTICTA